MDFKKVALCILLMNASVAWSASDTWEGDNSNSLNDTANWSTGFLPADEAIFDNTYTPGIPSDIPTSTVGFSADSFYFPHSASYFTFEFDDCTLTLNGDGITGNQTNTQINADNINNGSSLDYQVLFTGINVVHNPDYVTGSGSAKFNIVNSGIWIDDDYDESLNIIVDTQFASEIAFEAGVNATFIIANEGINHGSGYGLDVGVVGAQAGFDQNTFSSYQEGYSFSADQNLYMHISNYGEDFEDTGYTYSELSTTNNVFGGVAEVQLYIGDIAEIANQGVILIENTGENHNSGSNSLIGVVGSYDSPSLAVQMYVQDQLETGDNFSLTISNIGLDDGEFGSSNVVGGVGFAQYLTDLTAVGNHSEIMITNEGTVTDGSTNSYVGTVGIDYPSFGPFVPGQFVTVAFEGQGDPFGDSSLRGDYASLDVENLGTNSGDGSENHVGQIFGYQTALEAFFVGNHGTINIENKGINSAAANESSVGVVRFLESIAKAGVVGSEKVGDVELGSQFALYYGGPISPTAFAPFPDAPVVSGEDFFSTTISNEGDNSGSGSYNDVGYVANFQFADEVAFFAGNSSDLTVSNSGTNSGTGGSYNDVGYIGSGQAVVGAIQTGHDFALSVLNYGEDSSSGSFNQVGYIDSNVAYFDGSGGTGISAPGQLVTSGVSVGYGASIIVSNTGIDAGSSSNSEIGYVDGPQANFSEFISGYYFSADSGLDMVVSNYGFGEDSSTSSWNDVGYINGTQLIGDRFEVGNRSVVNVINEGSNDGGISSSYIGYVDGNQWDIVNFNNNYTPTSPVNLDVPTGTYSDNVTVTISNSGYDDSSDVYGSSSNAVGYVNNEQLVSNQMFFGVNGEILVSNLGTNLGSATNSAIGYVDDAQVNIQSLLIADDLLSINVYNEGDDASDGATNPVGYVSGRQLFVNELRIGDQTSIEVTNIGTSDASATDSSIGYVTGAQASLPLIHSFDDGIDIDPSDDFSLFVSNSGESSSDGIANHVGFLESNQIELTNLTLGNSTSIEADNIGTNLGSAVDSEIGVVSSNQIQFLDSGVAYFGDHLSLIASNKGLDSGSDGGENLVGVVKESQIVLGSSSSLITIGVDSTLEATNLGQNFGLNVTSEIGQVDNNQMSVESGKLELDYGLKVVVSNEGQNDTSLVYEPEFNSGDRNIGHVGGHQFHASNVTDGEVSGLFVYDGTSFTISNKGTTDSTEDDAHTYDAVGYVGINQFMLDGLVLSGTDDIHMDISNLGTNESSGSHNKVAYVNEYQLYSSNEISVENKAEFTFNNIGSNDGVNTQSEVACIGESQMFLWSSPFGVEDEFSTQSFLAGDKLSIVINNQGTNDGEGNNNSVGVVGQVSDFEDGQQLYSANDFAVGYDANITISNIGIDNGSGSSNTIGYVYYPQADFNANDISYNAITAGTPEILADGFSLSISQSGTKTGAGSNSYVGYVDDNQLHVRGLIQIGNDGFLSTTNSGDNSGSGVESSVGYVNYHQVSLENFVVVENNQNSFEAGNDFQLVISNTGTDSGTDGGQNYAGVVSYGQLNVAGFDSDPAGLFVVEDNGDFLITNSGSNSGSVTDSYIGYIGEGSSYDQVEFSGGFEAGNGLSFQVTNDAADSGNGSDNYIGYLAGGQLYSFGYDVYDDADLKIHSTGVAALDCTSTNSYIGHLEGYQVYFDYVNADVGGLNANDRFSLEVVNEGTDHGSGNYNDVGSIYGNQLYSVGNFFVRDDAIIDVSNTGVSDGSSNSSYIAYIGLDPITTAGPIGAGPIVSAPQVDLESSEFCFSAGDGLTFNVTNQGTNSGDSSENYVAYVFGEQLTAETLNVDNEAKFTIRNIGINSGSSVQSAVGVIGDVGEEIPNFSQLYVSTTFGASDGLEVTIRNSGIDSGTDESGNNAVGYVSGGQLVTDDVDVGDGATFTITNDGVNVGSSSDSLIGVIGNVGGAGGSFPQAAFFKDGLNANDDFTLIVRNSGIDIIGGSTDNLIGFVYGQQVYAGAISVGDKAHFEVTNIGTNTLGSDTINSQIGYIVGSQIKIGHSFAADDDLSMEIWNIAINTGNDSNDVGFVGDSQLLADAGTPNATFAVGENATITVNNILGYVDGDQMEFDGPFLAGSGANLTANNSGTVDGYQMYFGNNFTIGTGSSLTAVNFGEGTSNGGIYFEGTTSGGDMLINLTNSRLDVATTGASTNPFTIGGLNGDFSSFATSNQDLIINTDVSVNAQFSGLLNAPNLYKNGVGTQNLLGTAIISSTTTVNGGTLGLSSTGSLISPNVLINQFGTIAGNGTIIGNVLNNGLLSVEVLVLEPLSEVASKPASAKMASSAIAAPVVANPSIGPVLLIDGTYTQTDVGTLEVVVNALGESTQLHITGSGTLDGQLIINNVDGDEGFLLNSPYTILTADGHLANTRFEPVTAENFVNGLNPLLKPIVNYEFDDTEVDLTIVTNFEGFAAPGQGGIASVIDGITDPTDGQAAFIDQLLNLDPSALPSVLRDQSGNQYAYLSLDNQYADRRFGRRIFDMVRTELDPCRSVLNSTCEGSAAWAEVEIGRRWATATTDNFGVQTNSVDISGGIHGLVNSSLLLGVAGNFEIAHLDINQNKNNTYHDGQGALYGVYNDPSYYIFSDLVLGYSYSDFKRSVVFEAVNETTHSKPSSFHGVWYGEVGLNFDVCELLVQPFFGFDANFFRQFKTTESGGGDLVDLNLHEHTSSNCDTYLGSHFSYGVNNSVIVNVDLAWQHRFGNTPNALVSFVGVPETFTVDANEIGRDGLWGNLNVDVSVYRNLDLYGEFSGEYWDHFGACSFTFGANYRW